MKHVRLFWLLFVSTLAVDQLSKWWARAVTEGVDGRSIYALWPNVFELTLTYNKGIAFGMMQGKAVYMTPIALIIMAGCAIYSYRTPKEPKLVHAGLALVASGALGNLYDRIAMGKVTDMLHLRIIDFPVFNIADCCITIGAGLLIVMWSIESFRHSKEAKEIPATVDVAAAPQDPS